MMLLDVHSLRMPFVKRSFHSASMRKKCSSGIQLFLLEQYFTIFVELCNSYKALKYSTKIRTTCIYDLALMFRESEQLVLITWRGLFNSLYYRCDNLRTGFCGKFRLLWRFWSYLLYCLHFIYPYWWYWEPGWTEVYRLHISALYLVRHRTLLQLIIC